MHTGQSESSILRSLLDKSVGDKKKLLEVLQELVRALTPVESIDSQGRRHKDIDSNRSKKAYDQAKELVKKYEQATE